jgi:hypothetical protein
MGTAMIAIIAAAILLLFTGTFTRRFHLKLVRVATSTCSYHQGPRPPRLRESGGAAQPAGTNCYFRVAHDYMGSPYGHCYALNSTAFVIGT